MPLANPMKGEAQLGEHKLIINFNRLCELEEVTGQKVPDLLAELKAGLGFADLRLWLRALLDKDMSLNEVGDLLGELGPEVALKAISDALEAFFAPMAKDKKDRPLKAA